MKKKSNPLRVGIFVLAGLALGFGILAMLATDRLFTDTEKYVMHFEGNVDGLDVGSPVLYKGFRVGRVTDMRLVVDRESGEASLPVYVALEPERLTYGDGAEPDTPGRDFHIESGLRAQLQRKSLITGQMVIMLVEAPDSGMKVRERKDGIPEIPTIPTITRDLAETLRGLPLEQMINDTHASLRAVRTLLESGRIRDTLNSMDRTLERTDTTQGELVKTLEALRANLEPGTPSHRKLTGALEQIQDTAASLERLTDYLQRHPEALLKGKPEPRSAP